MVVDRALFDSKVQPLLQEFNGQVSYYIRKILPKDAQSVKEGSEAQTQTNAQADVLSFNEDVVMTLASTGKLFILGTLLEQLSAKGGSLEEALLERRIYRKEDKTGGSGVIQFLSEETAFTLYDLALLMIILSDNTATNMLLEEVGEADAVMEHLEKAGIVYSGVNRRISGKETSLKILEKTSALGLSGRVQNSFSRGTCREIAEYLAGIDEGRILSPAAREVFEAMLEKQQFKDMFPRYLPVEDFFEEEGDYVKVLNKTGFDGGTRSDAGILVVGEEKFSYAIIINDAKDTSYRPEQEAAMLMGKIGKAFYEALCCFATP